MKRKKKKFRPRPGVAGRHQVLRLRPATLALCMIARNEAANIQACLQDIKPVADEIIVVDTGSTDQTRELAENLGALVYDFPWCDDFSAARNESIKHANSDYIIWLDADDRVDPAEIEKIRKLKTLLPENKSRAYYFAVRSGASEVSNTHFLQLRLFPNIPAARFEWRIHEQISENLIRAGVKTQNLDIVIRHTGYPDYPTIMKKRERNINIIEQELKNRPGNPVMHFNAGRTLLKMQRQEDAVWHLRQVTGNPAIQKQRSGVGLSAGLLLGKYYGEINQYEAAEAVFQQLADIFPEDGLVHFFLGINFYKKGQFREAVRVLKKTLGFSFQCHIFPIDPDLIDFQRYFFLGRAYVHIEETNAAREMFLKSLGLHSKQYKSLEELGLLCLTGKKYAESIKYYAEAVQSGGGGTARNYSNLGLAYHKTRQFPEAQRAFSKALDLNPGQLEALTNLGYLHLKQKAFSQALSCFSRARNLYPSGLPDVKLALSEIYFRSANLDKLAEECESLLEELGLPRNFTLDGLADLAVLYERIGDCLAGQSQAKTAFMAYRLSALIYPLPEVLDKIMPLSSSPGRLEYFLKDLNESLQHHAHDEQALNTVRNCLTRLSLSAV